MALRRPLILEVVAAAMHEVILTASLRAAMDTLTVVVLSRIAVRQITSSRRPLASPRITSHGTVVVVVAMDADSDVLVLVARLFLAILFDLIIL